MADPIQGARQGDSKEPAASLRSPQPWKCSAKSQAGWRVIYSSAGLAWPMALSPLSQEEARLQPAAPGSAGAAEAGCLPACPPREGQGSKRSWLPADNPAAGTAGFPCRSPAETAWARARGLSPTPPRLPHSRRHGREARPRRQREPQPHCYAGGRTAHGLRHPSLIPMQAGSTADERIVAHRLCGGLDRMQQPRGLPGHNLPASKTEGVPAEQLESGRGCGGGTEPPE